MKQPLHQAPPKQTFLPSPSSPPNACRAARPAPRRAPPRAAAAPRARPHARTRRSRGSSRSRSPSPIRFSPSTVSTMASPGNEREPRREGDHRLALGEHPPPGRRRRLRPEPDVGEPGLGEDAERELDRRPARSGGSRGWAGCARPRSAPRPCRRPAPPARSRAVQSDSAAPRVSRAKTGMLKMPMAMIAFTADGPKTAVIMMAMSSDGKAKTRSLPRMIASSSSEPPPRRRGEPERHAEPMPMPTATSATAIETRAPTISIERTSRPKWSVPSQCAADGGCSLLGDVERRDVVGRPDEGQERRRQRPDATIAPPSEEPAHQRAAGAAGRPAHRRGRPGR